MDVKRAADLYGQGWTLRQIGAELGLTASTVSDHLRVTEDPTLDHSEMLAVRSA